MKKILVLSGVLLLSAGLSYAWIAENDTNSVDTLRAQGFSEAALKAVDLVNFENQGKNGNYQRVFTKKESKTKLGRGYQKVKYYVDPIQDDQNFGQHQINFTNNWTGDEQTYEPKESKSSEQQVENL